MTVISTAAECGGNGGVDVDSCLDAVQDLGDCKAITVSSQPYSYNYHGTKKVWTGPNKIVQVYLIIIAPFSTEYHDLLHPRWESMAEENIFH